MVQTNLPICDGKTPLKNRKFFKEVFPFRK